jgi:hypothetical protein
MRIVRNYNKIRTKWTKMVTRFQVWGFFIRLCHPLKYRTRHLKRRPPKQWYYCTKVKSEAGWSTCNRISLPWHSRSHFLLGRCSLRLRKSHMDAYIVYSWAEQVSVLEYYFASKSFVAVRKAFSNTYREKEISNKTTIHWLVTTFRDTWIVCVWQVHIERQKSWNYGRTDFKQCISCNNGIRPRELVSWFCAWRGSHLPFKCNTLFIESNRQLRNAVMKLQVLAPRS